MKKYNPDKLKKIHVYPLIIILIIVIFIVGVAISLLAGALFDNLTRGKISQGYKRAKRLSPFLLMYPEHILQEKTWQNTFVRL